MNKNKLKELNQLYTTIIQLREVLNTDFNFIRITVIDTAYCINIKDSSLTEEIGRLLYSELTKLEDKFKLL